MFPLLEKFQLDPNFHKSQNLYFEISMENKRENQPALDEAWIEQFNLLGKNLGVKVE